MNVLIVLLMVLGIALPAQARKVSVGIPVVDVSQSALYVARDRGYFQKEGLEVELVLMRGGVANQALITGNVDFTTVPTAALQAGLQGAPVKVLLSTFHKPMFWLYCPILGGLKPSPLGDSFSTFSWQYDNVWG